MRSKGLQKARSRLTQAFESFQQLRRAKNWEQFEGHWTTLLIALNAVFVILQQSARGFPKSEGWYAKLVGQRKSDELLSYLLHARNANEHGIADILQLKQGGVGIGSNRGGGAFIKELVIGPGGTIEKLEGHQLDGSPLEIVYEPSRAALIPVIDRGISYDPPEVFFGQKLSDQSPLTVAHHALEFLVVLLGEAEELIIESTGA